MRLFTTLVTLCALMNLSAFAQDRHDWQQATARLHAGDNLHISLKTGPVEAAFVSATPQELSVAGNAFKKEDILKIERVQTKGGGASSRTKHIAIGAAIGGGAGAGIGAAAGSCKPSALCFASRGEISGIFGAVGVAVGALVGALLPAHQGKHETIYSVG